MSSFDIEKLCKDLEILFKMEWMDRPEEIEQLEGRKGAWDCTFAVHINCMRESQEVLEWIWLVRNALKNGHIPLDIAGPFLGKALTEKSDKIRRYYKIKELPDILKQVSLTLSEIPSYGDFIKVTDRLLLYVGRYNYWLDADLDWKTLSETHESLREKQGERVGD
jgi:hypothetical protein